MGFFFFPRRDWAREGKEQKYCIFGVSAFSILESQSKKENGKQYRISAVRKHDYFSLHGISMCLIHTHCLYINKHYDSEVNLFQAFSKLSPQKPVLKIFVLRVDESQHLSRQPYYLLKRKKSKSQSCNLSVLCCCLLRCKRTISIPYSGN